MDSPRSVEFPRTPYVPEPFQFHFMDSGGVYGVGLVAERASLPLSIPFYGFSRQDKQDRRNTYPLSIPFYGFEEVLEDEEVKQAFKLSIPFYGFPGYSNHGSPPGNAFFQFHFMDSLRREDC